MLWEYISRLHILWFVHFWQLEDVLQHVFFRLVIMHITNMFHRSALSWHQVLHLRINIGAFIGTPYIALATGIFGNAESTLLVSPVILIVMGLVSISLSKKAERDN